MKGSTLLLIMAITMLAGCATPEPEIRYVQVQVPYEVKVPTYIERKPPGELVRPYVPIDYPQFTDPTNPDAVIGMTRLDWQRMQVILRTLRTRDEAWRNWSTNPGAAK